MSRPDARALWSPQARHFALDPERIFLNHGSFGACPRVVLEAQARFREELEREPVAFMVGRWEGLFDEVRAKLGAFLSCAAADLALVQNATHGVNTVLRSLELEPQDELLTTTHEYNATRNALDHAAERARARVVASSVPFPIAGPERVLEALLERVTPRTRLAVVDHVTSPTALVLPLERIVRELQARGVDVLVDGAHGPGMLPLALDALGAAYYTGNCHKWLCAPKGAAFLHVRADRQQGLRPLAISHGANDPRTDRSRFRLEFDFQGTLDPTPWLAIPAALEFLGGRFPGGWEELYRRNRALALEGRQILCAALERESPCPEAMIGSLAAVPLPSAGRRPGRVYADALQDRLVEHYGIQVPIYHWPALDLRVVRISAQIYNTSEQVRALAQALRECLA